MYPIQLALLRTSLYYLILYNNIRTSDHFVKPFFKITTGSDNIAIGYTAIMTFTALHNNTTIGYHNTAIGIMLVLVMLLLLSLQPTTE